MNIKHLTLIFTAAVTFFTLSFKAKSKQGLEGYIYFLSGNRMPSPDVKPVQPSGYSTTLFIYELTNRNQVSAINHSPFYSNIFTKLVKTVKSNDKGYFKVKLPPGHYSLFVKKDTAFYANLFEGDNINPVKVEAGKFTQVKMNVDYDAVY
ncbi:carboxypeptidase-like regulatory domain-containing protein [Pinibacter soli]|uniref:Carboxypeptidase-like regulatory domain-containing protein n=1 Tax=Pinibacter soli TaxID=3044211 RepID=A0ABT6RJ74_9BACT|nr:carboxypeptidase-like regulatory domain-containing protein [Pinibacter soli]MDI3322476.1 carboxypeptidase-like regulatory domain-containing protein [Pinibacter soli]